MPNVKRSRQLTAIACWMMRHIENDKNDTGLVLKSGAYFDVEAVDTESKHCKVVPSVHDVIGSQFAEQQDLVMSLKVVSDGMKANRAFVDCCIMACSVCSQKFENMSSLKNPTATHAMGWHTCHYCNKTFRYRLNFVSHMKQHTGLTSDADTNANFTCKVCSHQF